MGHPSPSCGSLLNDNLPRGGFRQAGRRDSCTDGPLRRGPNEGTTMAGEPAPTGPADAISKIANGNLKPDVVAIAGDVPRDVPWWSVVLASGSAYGRSGRIANVRPGGAVAPFACHNVPYVMQ